MDGLPDDPDQEDVAADWMLHWVVIFYRYDDAFLDVLRIQLNDRLPEEPRHGMDFTEP